MKNYNNKFLFASTIIALLVLAMAQIGNAHIV
ncbi:hypothetical protein BH23BAC3_BH23BAC3_31430 [soil metagenome]